jgi:carboxymethylenebutenolidase
MADYLALPHPDGRHGAIVVLHEWWGVNDQIRSIADRWASQGFVALVPDLYDGRVATTSADAEALMKALDFEQAMQTIAAAVASLRTHERSNGKVAISGYCMGGALAFAAATRVRELAAVAPFYGLPPAADWSKVDAPIQAHFAAHDDWATVAGAQKIESALAARGASMELHVYDAQHAFCNDRRPEVFDPDAAAQAWERTLAFVRSHTT